MRRYDACTLEGLPKFSAVGREVGYGSEAAFSRTFKKLTGVAPAAWRNRLATPGLPTTPGQ